MEKFETHIILIPVRHFDARKTCENLQNKKFDNHEQVWDEIPDDSKIYCLDEFMDDFNGEEIVADDFFMGYVQIKQ